MESPMKEVYDNNFYEEEGDPLAHFRKTQGGGFIVKNGKDPFDKDMDVIQDGHETKLRESQGNLNLF